MIGCGVAYARLWHGCRVALAVAYVMYLAQRLLPNIHPVASGRLCSSSFRYNQIFAGFSPICICVFQ